jgi:hypothetical protein
MSSLFSQKMIAIIGIFLFGSLFIYPYVTYADNLYGQSCGTTKCTGAEVCQKQYRGVLPIGAQNDGNATFTCVKPQSIEAPDSPYKGVQASCSGVFKKAFGLDLDTLTGSALTDTLQSGLGKIKSSLGLDGIAFGYDSRGPQILNFSNVGLNWNIDPTNLIATDASYFQDFVPKCDSAYNNIKGIINTNYLVAPLPVDIFNPLPLPVNITSPTPLPVVVVDDLALYQQKELIDAPLAAQQKAKTIATVSDTLRYQISNDNLIPNNYFALKSLGWQYGALDPNTGVVSKEAIDKYGSYQNFSLVKNEAIEQYFKDLQDQKNQLPDESFTQNCGNIKIEDAGDTSLECALLGLQLNNNTNDIAANIKRQAEEKSLNATELLRQEVDNGSGYFAKTNGDKNPFTKTIQSPGSNIANLTDKVLESTIDQAILGSGDRCFAAIPNNILEGSLKPVLTQGLYGVNNTLASAQSNIINNPVNTLQNPGNFANQLNSGLQGAVPDPNRFFKSLQNSLVQNVTGGLSCEFNKQISGLLNGALGNINIPGIGNVSGALTNTVNGALNNAVNNLIP